ncbi:MAG: ISL3 family transposase [Clostridia bacterium]|nr:ISL3 family transposase [Clostridia bacterium]
MQNHFITNLLDLKGVIVTKFRNRKNRIRIHIELPIREQTYPSCHSKTSRVHDYRFQLIKDIPFYYNKKVFLYYRKRRYVCLNCNKRFYEKNSFLPKRARKTNRLSYFIIELLKDKHSMKDVAKISNVSSPTVASLLPYLSTSASYLPEVLCIDEFRANSGNFKYQVSLIDGKIGKPIDIVECRHKHYLFSYFNKFTLAERNKVKYVIMDLWQPYKDLAKNFFPNAKIVADRFHYARYIVQAVDTVRKQVQSKLTPKERIYFKHSRKLLLSRYINLNREQREELNYILINYSEELRRVYNEKEELLDIIHSNDKYKAIDKLNKWIKDNLDANYEALKECAKTYSNWIQEIRNSLLVPYSNGVMEGYNNKIKVLKRVAFGFRNFQNFKARILLMN